MAISQPVPILTINYTETQSSTITDLTGTTWILNDIPDLSGFRNEGYQINFASNSTNYTYIAFSSAVIRYVISTEPLQTEIAYQNEDPYGGLID